MANAISVAVGIPHPWVYSGTEPAIKKYTKAGVTTPARAANTGSSRFEFVFSSPEIISDLIASPTYRKKRAINPSFTHSSISIGPQYTCIKAKYCSARGEFAVITPRIAASKSIIPPDDSD